MTQKQLAELAAALNDPKQSEIGDPSKGRYGVWITSDVKTAFDRAKALARHGVLFEIVAKPDRWGFIVVATLRLFDVEQIRNLANLLHKHLDEERLSEFRKLVLARGPMTPETRQRILDAWNRGMPPKQIVKQLVKHEIYDGMGKAWTASKIIDVIDEAAREVVPEAA